MSLGNVIFELSNPTKSLIQQIEKSIKKSSIRYTTLWASMKLVINIK
jgi:hypothetical protein